MGIFNDNPVLRREVRARLRLRNLVGSRPLAWGAVVTALVIIYFYGKGMVAIGHGQPEDARDLWAYLVLFLLFLIVLIAPALLSTAITQEREQQTWDALAITNLTAAEVLLGKWLARLSLTFLPVLVLLPYLMYCDLKGGLGSFTTVAVLLFLALTAGAYGVLGLLCSFFARKTVTATVVSLTVTIFLCVGTPILASLLSDYIRAASSDYSYHDPPILWVNPFYALNALVGAQEPRGVGMISYPDPFRAGLVVFVYLATATLACGAGLITMLLGYRRAVRD